MFGEKISFNIDGKESFDTCLGSFCTLIVFAIVATYAAFQIRLYQSQWSEVPITSTFLKPGHFLDPVEVRQDVNDFYFAVAVTGKQNFEDHTSEAFEAAGGSIDLKYVIIGGEEDTKVFDIKMNPCSDLSWFKPSGTESIDRIAVAHMNVKQFYCPSAFDMSFFGAADDVVKKVLFVDVKMNAKTDDDKKFLEGKHIAMLMNTREIEFYDNYEQV